MLRLPRWKLFSIVAVCLFFCAAALPNLLPQQTVDAFPSFMPKERVNLGLDLRGGSHLRLQIDFDAYLKEHFENVRDEIRNYLRKDGIGYLDLKATEDAVSFRIRPETIPEGPSVIDRVRKLDDQLEVEELEGDSYVVRFNPNALRVKQEQLLSQSIEIINRRINETGTKEPTIQRQGDDRILVQVPGMDNPEQLKQLLGKTAKMTFHLVNEAVTPLQAEQGIAPAGTRVLPSANDSGRTAIFATVALGGELLTNANPSFSDGQPVVEFTFNSQGARKFGEITQANVGKRFAVVLDGRVITAPVIRSSILGGKGIIEGNFTVESANELAILLRAGALPAPLNIIEERSVGPNLGADSVAAGEKAVLIATIAVMAYMILAYSLFGVFSVMALLMNIIIILGTLSLFQATLTLPGIAGIVLTVGMAVDANTLIFERIREELRNGKNAVASIESGFKTAFGTILDSNITTLIAAFILFYFGSGTVKGFAVTLSIGILSSMFTAVMLTKLIIVLWFGKKRRVSLPI